MAYQPEVANYDTGVYQLEINDPVQGGVGGLSNAPLLNLANRTAWLYQQLELVITGQTIPPTVAPLASPVFTGSPKAPTPALGDSSTLIATTAFVQGSISGQATINCAGGANVTLTAVQAGNGVLNLTGALTANIAVIVPQAGKWTVVNGTSGAYTVTVKTASGTGVVVTQGRSQIVWCDGTNVYQSVTDFISPALTGTPTAPTATAGTSTTQLATTAFVTNTKNGAVTVNVAGNANVTLTAAQAGVGIILLTGALTGAITVYVPAGTGQYIIANNTSGSYTLKIGVSGASGATAIVPQSNSVVAYSDGSNIVLAGAASTSSFTRYSFTATAAQTTFNAIYTVGNVLVLVNGVAQAPGDVTATDSATVVLSGYNGGAGCIGGEDVEIIAFSSFTVANAMTPAGGTFSGPVMLAGGDTGTTAALFDNSTKLATTAFVQRALGNRQGFASSGAATYNLAAADMGKLIWPGTAGAAVVLPAANSVPAGSAVDLVLTSATASVLSVAGGGSMIVGAGLTLAINGSSQNNTVTSLSLTGGTHRAVSDGANYWWIDGPSCLAYTGQFSSNLAGSGYQKLPSGLIIQWGTATISSWVSTTSNGTSLACYQGSLSVTFPIAFPNACLEPYAFPQANTQAGTWGAATAYPNSYSKTSMSGPVLAHFNPTSMTLNWIALGY